MAAAAQASRPADVYHLGKDTLMISRAQMHGAIRQRALEAFRAALAGKHSATGIILLQGGGPFAVYSTDGELLFKQESFMHYLFGVAEEDWYGALDVRSGASFLFMPRLPASYAVWMGTLKTPADSKAIYAVDQVHYVDEMAKVLRAQDASQPKGPVLHLLHGVNSDSGHATKPASFDGLHGFEVDSSSTLHEVLSECRVKKTAEEVAILRYANKVGSAGHVAMMQAAHHGMMEYELESIFLSHCYRNGGCRTAGYTPIAASGPNGAVLHYGHAGAPNDRQTQENDMLLLDMGCEYYRYGSDITTSWPVSGRFSEAQAMVYNGVLKAHTAVKARMRPGVAWPDMHALAYKTILGHLAEHGLLVGSAEELLENDIGALFMPHGLGHMLGIDTHDVGGYLPGTPPRSERPGFRSLRTARTLEEGMVITCEPGCYFNASLLLPAFEDSDKARFLVRSALEPLLSFGGVRLEDNILVTAGGCESFTDVPRTVQDIEAVMAGAAWPRK